VISKNKYIVRSSRKPARLLLAIGILISASLIIAAVFAPVLAPNDPYSVDIRNAFQPSGFEFPFGTDQLGRCILSRLLFGARTSLTTAILVTAVTFLIGITVGAVCGLFAGKLLDKALTALCEIILAFPGIILALVISGTLGPGILNMMLAIALVSWAGFSRVVRSLVISVKDAEYITTARTAGTRGIKLVTRHIFPNISGAMFTILVTNLGNTILQIAGLSFLGLGAQPPTAEWGMMINDARSFISGNPSLILYPIAAVSMAVLGFHLIGDGLKDISDSNEV